MPITFQIYEYDLVSVYFQVQLPNDVIRTYQFIPDGINRCWKHCFVEQIFMHINKNKYQAVFDLMADMARFHGFLQSFEFQIRLPFYNAAHLPIYLPYLNVHKITLLEMTSSAQCENWFTNISVHRVPNIVIGIRNGHRLGGLGNLEMIKNAESLIIEGGLCDISDAELRNFSCTEISIISTNITQAGMVEHMTRVTRMMRQANDGDDWIMSTRFPAFGDILDIAYNFLIPELRPFWLLENIIFHPPPAPENPI